MKTLQELFLDLIESAGKWNAFDGVKIAGTFRANRSLWRALIITDHGGELRLNEAGEVVGVSPSLAVLGGLEKGALLYDVIRAVPQAGHDGALHALLSSLEPDTVRWLTLEESVSAFGRTTRAEFVAGGFDPEHAILEAWWD